MTNSKEHTMSTNQPDTVPEVDQPEPDEEEVTEVEETEINEKQVRIEP